MSVEPTWTYDAVTQTLSGPEPKPEVPPVTSVSADKLGARDEHDVAEIDQDVGIVTLGTGYINPEWQQQELYCENTYTIPNWKRSGWYARFRRNGANNNFVLTHVWADEWGATNFKPWS